MIINSENPEKVKALAKKAERPIIVQGSSPEFNRKLLEYGKFDALIALGSPLNHIMTKLAAKNQVAIALDLEQLAKLEKKQKAKTLIRTIQNIKLCKKARTKIKLLNAKDKKDAFELLISLGASTSQAKEAIF